jgi:hypothetical protein
VIEHGALNVLLSDRRHGGPPFLPRGPRLLDCSGHAFRDG